MARDFWNDAARAADFIGRDAVDTVRRMRADAQHLAELGQRGKLAAKLAADAVKRDIERALDRFADRVQDIAARVKGAAS